MRIFVGIKVDAPTQFISTQKGLSDIHSKWVKEGNYHLTLVFIGQANVNDIERIQAVLQRIIKNHASFSIRIKGTGTFQKRRSSGVLWLGVENNNALINLQSEVESEIFKLMPQLKKQYNHYTPHITIARIKNKQELDKYQTSLTKANIHFTQAISEVILYKSVRTQLGIAYQTLATFKLK